MLSAHVVWLACLAFYAIDCVRFLRPQTLLLQEAAKDRWTPVLPILPSQPVSRTFGILDPFRPWRAVIASSWLNVVEEPETLQRRRIREKLRPLEPLRVVAQLEFFLLFLFGPLMTIQWGLATAILTVLSAHLVLSVTVLLVVIVRVRAEDMTIGAALSLWFECLVSPGYQANVFRRAVLGRAPFEVDALSLMRNSAGSSFSSSLVRYAEDLSDYGFVNEEHVIACRSLYRDDQISTDT